MSQGARLNASASYEIIRSGSMEAIRWLEEQQNCTWSQTAFNAAALCGKIEILEWAKRKGFRWSTQTCAYAASVGNLRALKWLHENGCPWNENTCFQAAKIGAWNIIKYAYDNGCPLEATAAEYAAANGHLNLLNNLYAYGCPWNSEITEVAAENGHWDVVEWLVTKTVSTFNPQAYRHVSTCCADARLKGTVETWKMKTNSSLGGVAKSSQPMHEQQVFA